MQEGYLRDELIRRYSARNDIWGIMHLLARERRGSGSLESEIDLIQRVQPFALHLYLNRFASLDYSFIFQSDVVVHPDCEWNSGEVEDTARSLYGMSSRFSVVKVQPRTYLSSWS